MKLDLGSGPRPKDGYKGVDIAEVTDFRLDFFSGWPWPWPDNSIEALHCSHFIEHIPADYLWCYSRGKRRKKDALFHFFDEAWRISQPNAIFTLVWPDLKSTNAFRDPTHRRFLPLEFTYYLNRQTRKEMGVEHYAADCHWLVIDTKATVQKQGDYHKHWNHLGEWVVTLQAIKP